MRKNEEVQVKDLLVPEAPTLKMSSNGAHKSKETRSLTDSKSHPISEHSLANARGLQERCRQLCLACFFDERAPIRSLGFTSSLKGEGKTFLATVSARVLANDSGNPVTLLECNWEHPTLHEYFGLSGTPGLA